jgi:hypothetical protein
LCRKLKKARGEREIAGLAIAWRKHGSYGLASSGLVSKQVNISENHIVIPLRD